MRSFLRKPNPGSTPCLSPSDRPFASRFLPDAPSALLKKPARRKAWSTGDRSRVRGKGEGQGIGNSLKAKRPTQGASPPLREQNANKVSRHTHREPHPDPEPLSNITPFSRNERGEDSLKLFVKVLKYLWSRMISLLKHDNPLFLLFFLNYTISVTWRNQAVTLVRLDEGMRHEALYVP